MPRGRPKKKVSEPKTETKKEPKTEVLPKIPNPKQEAADYLVSLGYNASVIDGVVITEYQKGEGEGFHEKIEDILKKYGYHASFGTRCK